MNLVIDANRIISALIKGGLTSKIICSDKFEFFTASYVMDEVKKYEQYILTKSHMSREQVTRLFSVVMENVRIIPEEGIRKHIKEAIAVMKDVDINDAPIIACALAVPNEGVWTEDKDFDRQDKVKVWKTEELKALL